MNVLVVDDQPSARAMLRRVVETLEADLVVQEFGDPTQALRWSEDNATDLVLLDYRMPQMDGIEFAQRFRRPPANRDVPILLITVVGDDPVREAALEAGVHEFLQKPVRPKELRARCRNLLGLRRQSRFTKDRLNALERQLTAEHREADWRERESVFLMSKAIELRAPWLGAHAARVSRYAGLLAEALGLSPDEAHDVELAASVADIGMIGVPDAIWEKSGALDAEERIVVEAHAMQGHELLRDHHGRYLQLAAQLALGHHERHDGSGYPQRLSGDTIPVAVRIVAVADVLAALLAPRAWRARWSTDAALAHFREQRGRLFDPAIVDALTACWPRVLEADAAMRTTVG
jgi:two-component system, response regulator RpfG